MSLGLVFACLPITVLEDYVKLVFGLGLGLYIPIVILLSSFIFDVKRLKIKNPRLSAKYRKIATFILQAPNCLFVWGLTAQSTAKVMSSRSVTR